jgi:hypothetical protein
MTTTWKQALAEGALSGSIASVTSTLYLAWAGRRRSTAAAPVNATSHWFFGDPALREDRLTLRHTLTGYAIHHAASVFWGVLHARFWAARPQNKRPLPALAGSVAAASAACFVDYRLTPKRLTPGFEHRLDRPELAGVYACFAAGLLVGTLLLKRR